MVQAAKARVLLVEDNRPISRLIGVILASAGFAVSTVDNGRRALDAISESHPDLVLLDLELPDTDGFRVLARIREDDTVMTTCVVAFTSHTEHDIVQQVHRAGFDGYISKPVVPDEFVAQIEKYLASD
jgi:DNA-binding response OmpR family regulator